MQGHIEQATLRDIRQELEQIKSRLAQAERRARTMGGGALTLGVGTTLASLLSRVTALENKTYHFSRVGNEVFITGANLHIRNGSGATDGPVNGLGNLIVGYNEPRGSGDDRSGSHNIVVGARNNFSSFGGLVVGSFNTISGAYASVSGGNQIKSYAVAVIPFPLPQPRPVNGAESPSKRNWVSVSQESCSQVPFRVSMKEKYNLLDGNAFLGENRLSEVRSCWDWARQN